MSKDYAEQRAAILRNLDGLHYEVDPKKKVGLLCLDRPPLNVASYRGRSQIAAILEAFGQDPDVRVVVIRGKNGVYTWIWANPRTRQQSACWNGWRGSWMEIVLGSVNRHRQAATETNVPRHCSARQNVAGAPAA